MPAYHLALSQRIVAERKGGEIWVFTRDLAARDRAHELVQLWDGRPGPLGSLLGRVTPVDQVGIDERASSLMKRPPGMSAASA